MATEKKLILPVYLNQKIVFDMLAILENGFTQIRSIEKKESSKGSTGSEVEGSAGTGNTFGFFSLKLGSSLKTSNAQQDQQKVVEDRVHTPTSLLSRLLEYLDENKLIKEISDLKDLSALETGEFVSMKGTISVNPVVKTFNSMSHMMDLVASFMPRTTGKSGTTDTTKQTVDRLKKLNEALQVSGLVDLLQTSPSGIAAISQADISFFENKNVAILENGEYTVVGKVIKIVNDSSESINLLRNTSLSAAGSELIDKMFLSFQSDEIKASGINIPHLKARIENGVLIIPIAIYT